MKPTCFIFGFGYTAKYFAAAVAQLGFKVVGTKRQLNAISNSQVIQFIDFAAPDLEQYLSQSTHILLSIPPIKPIADLVLSHYAPLIKRYAANIQWLGYLSSTGVYGDHQGQWVDEESICKPQSTSGVLRWEAEQAWLSLAEEYQLPLHIFRLAGIYGPGRNVLDRINLGKKFSIIKEGQVFSRIHVEDIVSVLIASINNIKSLSIYNVADDEPEASHIVDAYATSLLHCPPLPLVRIEDAVLSTMEQEFYSSNRRVSNKKIKTELKIDLHYPSFREGLRQIWEKDFAN